MITLTSPLLGKIEAKFEKTLITHNTRTANKDAAVLVSAEILGERLLGTFQPDSKTIRFGNQQGFFNSKGFVFERAAYDRVVRQLWKMIADKKTRDGLSWYFDVRIEDGLPTLFEALETLPEHVEYKSVRMPSRKMTDE